jgi:hypothetical protein
MDIWWTCGGQKIDWWTPGGHLVDNKSLAEKNLKNFPS